LGGEGEGEGGDALFSRLFRLSIIC
jgi:hypothetical protein